MRKKPVKVLCTGDVHIGRRSSRIPAHLNGPRFSAARTWNRLIDLALAESVDLLVIAGDLIDQDNRFFEAIGPLEEGFNVLEESGIAAWAVAGNHDYSVLDRMAKSLSAKNFRVLGASGHWEKQILRRRGHDLLQVLGWSFKSSHEINNPLLDLDIALEPGIPALGLVHLDLNQASGPYAPCSAEELRQHPLDIWVTAHQHKPRVIDPGPNSVILHTGSPQALDPGETGIHGPWLVELEPGVRPKLRQVPISSVRYEPITSDLDDLGQPDAVLSHINKGIFRYLTALGPDSGPLELILCRLILKGRTKLHGSLPGLLAELERDLELSYRDILLRVEKLQIDTRPLIDLNELASSAGPPAHLARLILDLEADDFQPTHNDLLREARENLSRLHQARPYLPLAGREELEPEQVRQLLIRQGLLLLDSLLAQKEGS